jgi:hypothetical protein
MTHAHGGAARVVVVTVPDRACTVALGLVEGIEASLPVRKRRLEADGHARDRGLT